MPEHYKYELWNGKEVVGYYYSRYVFWGRTLCIPEECVLKQSYRRKAVTIEVPIITRVVEKTHSDHTIRVCLDVRRKSRRQIEIIMKAGH